MFLTYFLTMDNGFDYPNAVVLSECALAQIIRYRNTTD